MRTVLSGMIAANLIIGPAVGRAEVDELVLAGLESEGNSNEPAGSRTRIDGGLSGQFHLNGSVVKDGPFYDRICFAIWHVAVFSNLYGAFAEVFHGFQSYVMRYQLIYRLSR